MLEDSERALKARTVFLGQLVSDQRFGYANAHLALALDGSALYVVAAARQVAEQLWAREGASSFQKMASRIGEIQISSIAERSSVFRQTRDRYEANINKLDTQWKADEQAVLKFLKTEDSGEKARWREIVGAFIKAKAENAVSRVERALWNWCDAAKGETEDRLSRMDASIRVLAFYLPQYYEMTQKLREEPKYRLAGEFFEDTIVCLSEILGKQILLHARREQ